MTPTILRYVDVLVVVLVAPFVILMGAPALGIAVGAGTWLVQSAAAELSERRAATMTEPARALTLGLVSSLTRVFFLALMIVVVRKAGGRADGLAIAVLLLAAFTLHLSVNVLIRSQTRRAPTA